MKRYIEKNCIFSSLAYSFFCIIFAAVNKNKICTTLNDYGTIYSCYAIEASAPTLTS